MYCNIYIYVIIYIQLNYSMYALIIICILCVTTPCNLAHLTLPGVLKPSNPPHLGMASAQFHLSRLRCNSYSTIDSSFFPGKTMIKLIPSRGNDHIITPNGLVAGRPHGLKSTGIFWEVNMSCDRFARWVNYPANLSLATSSWHLIRTWPIRFPVALIPGFLVFLAAQNSSNGLKRTHVKGYIVSFCHLDMYCK